MLSFQALSIRQGKVIYSILRYIICCNTHIGMFIIIYRSYFKAFGDVWLEPKECLKMKQWKCSRQDNQLADSAQRKKLLILHCTWVSFIRVKKSTEVIREYPGISRVIWAIWSDATVILHNKSLVILYRIIKLLSIWEIQLYHWRWTYHWWWLEFIKILLFELNVNNHLF